MFESSALFATVALASLFATYASAADSVDNYTGTIADVASSTDNEGNASLENLTVAVEVEQKGSQVSYSYAVSGTRGDHPGMGGYPDAFFNFC